MKEPTAWQNFIWDVQDWIAEHWPMFFAILLIVMLAMFSVAEAEEATVLTEDGWLCFAPYSEKFEPEFWIENMSVTLFWYDTQEEFAEDTGEEDPEVHAFSLCETKPDKNFAYCDVYMVKPQYVDDVRSADFGHEAFHGLFGAYHE